ncbi:MAG: hypothetical protein QM689_12530 [Oscillospiraceae bacterium]
MGKKKKHNKYKYDHSAVSEIIRGNYDSRGNEGSNTNEFYDDFDDGFGFMDNDIDAVEQEQEDDDEDYEDESSKIPIDEKIKHLSESIERTVSRIFGHEKYDDVDDKIPSENDNDDSDDTTGVSHNITRRSDRTMIEELLQGRDTLPQLYYEQANKIFHTILRNINNKYYETQVASPDKKLEYLMINSYKNSRTRILNTIQKANDDSFMSKFYTGSYLIKERDRYIDIMYNQRPYEGENKFVLEQYINIPYKLFVTINGKSEVFYYIEKFNNLHVICLLINSNSFTLDNCKGTFADSKQEFERIKPLLEKLILLNEVLNDETFCIDYDDLLKSIHRDKKKTNIKLQKFLSITSGKSSICIIAELVKHKVLSAKSASKHIDLDSTQYDYPLVVHTEPETINTARLFIQSLLEQLDLNYITVLQRSISEYNLIGSDKIPVFISYKPSDFESIRKRIKNRYFIFITSERFDRTFQRPATEYHVATQKDSEVQNAESYFFSLASADILNQNMYKKRILPTKLVMEEMLALKPDLGLHPVELERQAFILAVWANIYKTCNQKFDLDCKKFIELLNQGDLPSAFSIDTSEDAPKQIQSNVSAEEGYKQLCKYAHTLDGKKIPLSKEAWETQKNYDFVKEIQGEKYLCMHEQKDYVRVITQIINCEQEHFVAYLKKEGFIVDFDKDGKYSSHPVKLNSSNSCRLYRIKLIY